MDFTTKKAQHTAFVCTDDYARTISFKEDKAWFDDSLVLGLDTDQSYIDGSPAEIYSFLKEVAKAIKKEYNL